MTDKGWFIVEGRDGDRTLEMQTLGLDPLFTEVAEYERHGGVSILDVGCAEGLIAIELGRWKAHVHGIDIVASHIEAANRLVGGMPCTFEVADANDYRPIDEYDIVLLLAILHKLKDPSAACAKFALAAKSLVVMRLPPEHAPTVVDERSDYIPHDMKAVMTWYGFELERVTRGSFAEWTGYFRKRKK